MPLEQNFPQRLRLARESYHDGTTNMSDLARLCSVSPQAVQQWETGQVHPKEPRIRQIAETLGVRWRWLAFGEAPMKSGQVDLQTVEQSTSELDEVGALPTDAWQAALTAALPEHLRGNTTRRLDLGMRSYRPSYLSPTQLAEVRVVTPSSNTCGLRVALCDLAVMAKVLGQGGGERRVSLILGLEGHADWLASISWEAATLGIQVLVAPTPHHAAAVLAAGEQ